MLLQPTLLGKVIEYLLPPTKLPSSQRNSCIRNYFTPQQINSFLKSRTPPPASKPPNLSQKSSVPLSQVNTLSAAALSQKTITTQVMAHSAVLKSTRVLGCFEELRLWQVVPILCRPVNPPGIKLSDLQLSRGLLPNTLSSAIQTFSSNISFDLKTTSRHST